MPASLIDISGIVPLSQTIFLWARPVTSKCGGTGSHTRQMRGTQSCLEYPGRRPAFHLPSTGISARPRMDCWRRFNWAYYLLFIAVGLLHWRPIRFLRAVAESIPATCGVLLQFPFDAMIVGDHGYTV